MMNPLAEQIKAKFDALKPIMDERQRRLWAATEARALGRGGISRVVEATGLSAVTIRAGLKELRQRLGDEVNIEPVSRLRRAGGGRRRLIEHDTTLLQALEALVDPVTRGDPQSPLRWTCKSTAKLANALNAQGHPISSRTVNTVLHLLGYSLQAPRKIREGGNHPDWDVQFRYINTKAKGFQRRAQPVVSVDAKKKELIGDFYNKGQEWQPRGQPEPVRVYDFIDRQLGKVIPYGVYDLSATEGWVSVGVDHDTAAFAVETLRRWWQQMGSKAYRTAQRLLIIADGGGSNGSRCRLWKLKLQELADETGLLISISHLPPGTSKWNKIEHRLFCHITENWRGRPLVSHEVVVNLISNTTTTTGLQIRAALDHNPYPTGLKVTPAQMNELTMKRHKFHGNWNYTIISRTLK